MPFESRPEARKIDAHQTVSQTPNDGEPYVVGVDLGGTKLLAGIADCQGHLLFSHEEPTQHGGNGRVIGQIADLVRRLAREAAVEPENLAQVVIGVPAVVSPQTGLASLSPNLALPEEPPLSELVSAQLGIPVVVENDVNLAAFGEAMGGHGNAVATLAFVSFGTGVGMGLVIDGKLVRGVEGRAGEIGFLPAGTHVHERAPLSENGLYEDAVGTAGIRQRFLRPDETVVDLFRRAEAGDAASLQAIDDIAAEASKGIAAIHALIDPALTVIGGGIGSHPLFMARLREKVSPLLPFSCRLEVSRFGARAGLMGALLLGIDLMKQTTNETRQV